MGPMTTGLHRSIRRKYRRVAERAAGHFVYPVGRRSALRLGYRAGWLEGIPPGIVSRFVGVGNPFSIRRPARGGVVLDLGCGCGMDVLVAARLVGPRGAVAGIDLTPQMLVPARRAAARRPNVTFIEGNVETLPFETGTFDLAISNGVLNLAPDKDAAYREIRRVLRPGGILAVADLLVVETIPPETLAGMDAWSS